MKKFIVFLFRLFFLIMSVLFGFFIVRAWKTNKISIKPQLEKIKKRLADLNAKGNKEGTKNINKEVKGIVKNRAQEFGKPAEKTKIKQEIKKNIDPEVKIKEAKLTSRQSDILAVLKNKKIADMKDMLNKVSGVTERTLRRDLLKLQELGFLRKEGTTKSVKYHLIVR